MVPSRKNKRKNQSLSKMTKVTQLKKKTKKDNKKQSLAALIQRFYSKMKMETMASPLGPGW